MAKLKISFEKKYPNVLFNRIKMFDDTTDDGCIHCIDTLTKQIFSWDVCENEWVDDI